MKTHDLYYKILDNLPKDFEKLKAMFKFNPDFNLDTIEYMSGSAFNYVVVNWSYLLWKVQISFNLEYLQTHDAYQFLDKYPGMKKQEDEELLARLRILSTVRQFYGRAMTTFKKCITAHTPEKTFHPTLLTNGGIMW